MTNDGRALLTRFFRRPDGGRAMITYPSGIDDTKKSYWVRDGDGDRLQFPYSTTGAAIRKAMAHMAGWRRAGYTAEPTVGETPEPDFWGWVRWASVSVEPDVYPPTWADSNDPRVVRGRSMRIAATIVTRDPGRFIPGAYVHLGVDLPAISGFTGRFVMESVTIDADGPEPCLNVQMSSVPNDGRPSPHAQIIAAVMADALTDPNGTPAVAPDWAAIWDRLGGIPAGQRPAILAEIQRRHRDALADDERRRRIEARAREIADAQRAAADREQAEILRTVETIRTREEFGPTARRIDLDAE